MSIQIFGDSELLIKMLNSEDQFNNSALNNTLQRIQNSLKEFDSVASYHILWDLNTKADSMENLASMLAQGNLSFNGEPYASHPFS